MRELITVLGLAISTLIVASCSSAPAPTSPPKGNLVDYRSALKFGFAGYMGEFPATIANGHHGGAFMTWVTPSEFTTHGSTLFDKYKDTPSPENRAGLMPCILGAIAGESVNHGSGITWETTSAERNGNCIQFVVQSRLQFTISSRAECWAGYALDLSHLPEGISRAAFHFRQFSFEFEPNADTPSENTPFADFDIDISALEAENANYTAELQHRRKVVRESPQKTFCWAWEVAQNWRGIEILDGGFTYYEHGAVKSLWTFKRGSLSGKVLTPENTSYETKGGEWIYLVIDAEGEIVDGQREGPWKARYSDGKPCYERNYRKGVIVSGKQWYPDGSLQSESKSDGERELNTFYDAWGKKQSETEFLGNEKDGYQRYWWGNGQMREERWYEKGKAVGIWRRWNHEGILTQEEPNPPWKR